MTGQAPRSDRGLLWLGRRLWRSYARLGRWRGLLGELDAVSWELRPGGRVAARIRSVSGNLPLAARLTNTASAIVSAHPRRIGAVPSIVMGRAGIWRRAWR